MSAIIIPFETQYLNEVKEIFFTSSTRKNFNNDEEKESFFYKYLGFYLSHYPELAWVAYDGKVSGYVVGSPVSHDDQLYAIQPHLQIFGPDLLHYPAHLHINCHDEFRGKGIGKKLVLAFEKSLNDKKIHGLHIMTGVDSKNRSFYKNLGFIYEHVEVFHGSSILFMGKTLSPE
jgi:ribosomal protein S18 acetylase RimI-like enzyme